MPIPAHKEITAMERRIIGPKTLDKTTIPVIANATMEAIRGSFVEFGIVEPL